jgi:hypothetical protein
MMFVTLLLACELVGTGGKEFQRLGMFSAKFHSELS